MPLFGKLPNHNFKALDAGGHLAKFDARQMLFLQEAPSDAAYKIILGAAQLYRLLPDGRRQILGFVLPGDYVGISMYPNRKYTCQALGSTTALRLDLQTFRKAVLGDRAMLKDLLDLAHRQLDGQYELMMTVGCKLSEQKIAWFLLDFKECWERVHGACEDISLPMTRSDIGDYLGLTIETVSRNFTKLAHENVIVLEPHAVRVIDPERLGILAQRSLH
jgi:CRP/FNR family transcriptional regulator, anaerobic regulatory protein